MDNVNNKNILDLSEHEIEKRINKIAIEKHMIGMSIELAIPKVLAHFIYLAYQEIKILRG